MVVQSIGFVPKGACLLGDRGPQDNPRIKDGDMCLRSGNLAAVEIDQGFSHEAVPLCAGAVRHRVAAIHCRGSRRNLGLPSFQSKAVRSSCPIIRLKFCTATPLAPRMRLSSQASTRIRSPTMGTVRSMQLAPSLTF